MEKTKEDIPKVIEKLREVQEYWMTQYMKYHNEYFKEMLDNSLKLNKTGCEDDKWYSMFTSIQIYPGQQKDEEIMDIYNEMISGALEIIKPYVHGAYKNLEPYELSYEAYVVPRSIKDVKTYTLICDIDFTVYIK